MARVKRDYDRFHEAYLTVLLSLPAALDHDQNNTPERRGLLMALRDETLRWLYSRMDVDARQREYETPPHLSPEFHDPKVLRDPDMFRALMVQCWRCPKRPKR